MLTFTTFRSCSSAIRSRTGETAWHGPHHSAQKSTITLPPVLSTSVSNVSLVALVAIPSFPLMSYSVPNVAAGAFVPDPGTVRTHVYAPTGQARSPHARGGDPRALGAGGDLRAAPRAQSRRPDLVVRRRPRDGEQAGTGGAHRLGSHAQGRLPAVQGASRLRPALPERLRLPGPLDRGRRRAGARAELEAGDRGVRARGVREQVPRRRRPLLRCPDARLEAPRPVDGLGHGLLHVQRHEHRVHLEVPQERARQGLALPRAPRDGLVPALRHLSLTARADAGRRVSRAQRPLALRALPAEGEADRVDRRLDDDAVDAARERRGSGAP